MPRQSILRQRRGIAAMADGLAEATEFPVLSDQDLARILSPEETVSVIEQALRARAEGRLVSPPRWHLPAERGSVAITAGGETQEVGVVGFFAAFWHPDMSGSHAGLRQVAAAFDPETGKPKGVLFGGGIMSLRTGATNAVALKYLSRPNSTCLGMLGSGVQAHFALETAAVVRAFELVKVYSPNPTHREEFAAEMGARLGLQVRAVPSAEEAVREADVLVCATSSPTPVFEVRWLKPGVHITTIGAKYTSACEVPLEAVELSALVVTDSFGQVDSQGGPFGKHFLADTPHRARMVELSDVVAGKVPGRQTDEQVTLFSSVGLAGTEMVLADRAFSLAAQSRA